MPPKKHVMHVNMTNTRSVFIVKFHASHTHTLSLDEDHECVNNSCPLDVLARQRKKDEKREKKPFAKHQVLFVPRVTSPYTHPTAPIESQQNILLVGCFRMVCDQEQGTENQKIKKQSIVDQVQKKKLQSLFRPKKISSLGPRTSRKKISRAFLAKKEKEKIKKNPKIQRNPIHKTPSLFCPSCCIAMHPPPPPLESQQKTCVFWTVCMACDRELAEKGGGEKHSRRKKPIAKRQVLFVPLVVSLCSHQHFHLKANKRLYWWDVLGWGAIESRRRKWAVERHDGEPKKGEIHTTTTPSPFALLLHRHGWRGMCLRVGVF